MNNRNWIPWLLAAVVSVGVGIAAYNAGLSHGLATAVSTAAAAAAPNTVVTVTGWRPGWHHWHPFGFFPFFLFVFFWFVVARAFFWRGGWHRFGPPPAWHDRFDQWHRDAHERMNRPAEPTRL
jgi:hypothetical protein